MSTPIEETPIKDPQNKPLSVPYPVSKMVTSIPENPHERVLMSESTTLVEVDSPVKCSGYYPDKPARIPKAADLYPKRKPSSLRKQGTDAWLVSGFAMISNWPALLSKEKLYRTTAMYDEYGFRVLATGRQKQIAPVSSIAERKFKMGIISREEYDHIMMIVQQTEEQVGESKFDLDSQESWDTFIAKLNPNPAAAVLLMESPTLQRRRLISPGSPSRIQYISPAGSPNNPGYEKDNSVEVDATRKPLMRSSSMSCLASKFDTTRGLFAAPKHMQASLPQFLVQSENCVDAPPLKNIPVKASDNKVCPLNVQIKRGSKSAHRRSKSLQGQEVLFRMPVECAEEIKRGHSRNSSASSIFSSESSSDGRVLNEYDNASVESTASTGLVPPNFIGRSKSYGAMSPGSKEASEVSYDNFTLAPKEDGIKTAWTVMLSYTLPIESQELHDLIGSGIPPSYRSYIWHHFINAYVGQERVLRGPGYYNALSNVHTDISKKIQRSIEMDLLRTLPDNKHFMKSDAAGIAKLRRVLTAYARRCPTVGYCQGFNFIAAFALLVLPEETAFWCLVAIIEHIMPAGYFHGDLSSARVDQQVMRRAVELWCPEISSKFREYDFDINVVTFSWFMTLFADSMPHYITLRIWDLLLLKGSIVLFQSTFSFLKMAESTITATKSRLELFSVMMSLSAHSTDTDKLICGAFDCPIEWGFIRHHRKMCATPTNKAHGFLKEQYFPKSPNRQKESIAGIYTDADDTDEERLYKLKMRLDFSESESRKWWEPLCPTKVVHDLFLATAQVMKKLANSRGINYLQLKSVLNSNFDENVIDRNKTALEVILKTHELKVFNCFTAHQDGYYLFDDVVMYPALVIVNKLIDLPTGFEILYERAKLNAGIEGYQLPPSPKILPAIVPSLLCAPLKGDVERTSNQEVSEQVIRNRTAELCNLFEDREIHYMTVKRKLIAEFGQLSFEKFKRTVQAVFRSQTESICKMTMHTGWRLTAKKEMAPERTIAYDVIADEFRCSVFVPSMGPRRAQFWCGTNDGSVAILTDNGDIEIIKRHSSATSCIAHHAKYVWTGSDDGSICITHKHTLRLEKTLYEATGAIMSIHFCEIDSGHEVMWCGTSTGQILQYSTDSATLHRTIFLQVPVGSFYAQPLDTAPGITGMYAFAEEPAVVDLLNGRMKMPERRFLPATVLSFDECSWIGTGRQIVIIKNSNEASRVLSWTSSFDDEIEPSIAFERGRIVVAGDDLTAIECDSSLCLTSPRRNDVWSCSHYQPYMYVWHAESDHPIKKMTITVPSGPKGIVSLISNANEVWGCGLGGEISMWNASNFLLLKCIRTETPVCTTICTYSEHEVAGIGSNGVVKLSVWCT